MSNIFRHTIWVSVLMCGALMTACHSSSDKGQPSKVERTQAVVTSTASEPTTRHRSVASTKPIRTESAAHAKADADGKPNKASIIDPLSSAP